MKLRVTLARLAADAAHWGTTRLLHRGGGNIPGTVALRVDPNVVGELRAAERIRAEGEVVVPWQH